MKTRKSFLNNFLALALLILIGCGATDSSDDDNNNQNIPLDGRGGGIICFNSGRDGNGELYIMNADGTGQKNITHNPDNDGYGSWSPNGMSIAFVSDRGGSYAIYRMDVIDMQSGQFSEPVKIASKRPSSRVSWSPDGTELIFDAWPECDIYTVNSDGTNLNKLIATPEQEFQPYYSPDGSQIVYCRTVGNSQNIWIMNRDGSNMKSITNDGVSYFPTWSPDGNTIAFNSIKAGRQDADICLTDINGNNRQWLTDYSNLDEFPTWSPDGNRIAYQSNRGVHKIYIINKDGSNNNPITTNTSFDNGEPGWRPNN